MFENPTYPERDMSAKVIRFDLYTHLDQPVHPVLAIHMSAFTIPTYERESYNRHTTLQSSSVTENDEIQKTRPRIGCDRCAKSAPRPISTPRTPWMMTLAS